jgi:hypothetical protein
MQSQHLKMQHQSLERCKLIGDLQHHQPHMLMKWKTCVTRSLTLQDVEFLVDNGNGDFVDAAYKGSDVDNQKQHLIDG